MIALYTANKYVMLKPYRIQFSTIGFAIECSIKTPTNILLSVANLVSFHDKTNFPYQIALQM